MQKILGRVGHWGKGFRHHFISMALGFKASREASEPKGSINNEDLL
jgi:hypothetical protein